MKNPNRFLPKAITLLLALALLLGMVSTSAMADYTVATGNDNATVTMNKYLVMDAAATVPTVTFQFSIAAGDAATITVDGKTQIIKSGVTGGIVSDAAFAPGQTGMTEVKDTVADGDKADIGDTMPAGKKYYRQTATISLVGMTFTEPEIYRYIITENTATVPASVPGVSNDAATTRVLDVYVGYKDDAAITAGTLSILGTVLHNATSDEYSLEDEKLTYEGKKKGFKNDYTTHNLILSKTVAGNQGYRSQYFPFKITIGGTGVAGSFAITKGDGTEIDTVTEIPGFAGAHNVNTLTAGTEATVYLKHNDSIKINGLPAGATYTINEDKATCADYTTTITDNNGGTITVPKVEGTMAAADATVGYTNTRNGIVPTGILLDIWPYILMVAVAAVALIVLMSSKRKYAAR